MILELEEWYGGLMLRTKKCVIVWKIDNGFSNVMRRKSHREVFRIALLSKRCRQGMRVLSTHTCISPGSPYLEIAVESL
jgi:hypothetical protein